jgi:hypothetical protein
MVHRVFSLFEDRGVAPPFAHSSAGIRRKLEPAAPLKFGVLWGMIRCNRCPRGGSMTTVADVMKRDLGKVVLRVGRHRPQWWDRTRTARSRTDSKFSLSFQ